LRNHKFSTKKEASEFYAKEWGTTINVINYNIDKANGINKYRPKAKTTDKPVVKVKNIKVETSVEVPAAKPLKPVSPNSKVLKPKVIAQLRQKSVIMINENIRIEVPGNSVTINGDLISW
jgi:hypothetical protein